MLVEDYQGAIRMESVWGMVEPCFGNRRCLLVRLTGPGSQERVANERVDLDLGRGEQDHVGYCVSLSGLPVSWSERAIYEAARTILHSIGVSDECLRFSCPLVSSQYIVEIGGISIHL